MSLTADDFEEFVDPDPTDDASTPLGDALAELAVAVDVDAVEAVREIREDRWRGCSIRTSSSPQ